MGDISDTYLTIEGEAETVMRERSSKFYSFAYHVESEEQISQHLDALRKQYYDATHHCYAWRLGPAGERFRANDDGEPSGTAGRPILGQMLSHGITDALIVVVRYFGGTKLGVPGLIAAYKQGAADAIGACVSSRRSSPQSRCRPSTTYAPWCSPYATAVPPRSKDVCAKSRVRLWNFFHKAVIRPARLRPK